MQVAITRLTDGMNKMPSVSLFISFYFLNIIDNSIVSG